MQKISFVLLVLALCACLALTVGAEDDGNYGEDITFGPAEEDSVQQTTTPEQSDTNTPTDTSEGGTTAEPDVTDPAGSESGEGTTAPDAGTTEGATDGTSEGTTPEESVSEDATTEPGEQTTDPMEQQTTEMTTEQPSESGTQSTEPAGGLPMPAIIAGLAVLGVACLALVVFLVIKYFRAQKQD